MAKARTLQHADIAIDHGQFDLAIERRRRDLAPFDDAEQARQP